SRGPKVSDGFAVAGTLEIPLPGDAEQKPGWIVDGQQRALALARSSNRHFPVPVSAFIAETVELQRDQFIRINNQRPLPRGLVTELLPTVSISIPARLAARQLPAALCEALNTEEKSPFRGLIRRASTPNDQPKKAVVADNSIVKALEESLNSGCL